MRIVPGVLYLRGLPYELTEAELYELGSRFGIVEDVQVVTDRDTGKSRGFGFIHFRSPDDADAALAELNGAVVNTRTLHVDYGRDMRRPRSA